MELLPNERRAVEFFPRRHRAGFEDELSVVAEFQALERKSDFSQIELSRV